MWPLGGAREQNRSNLCSTLFQLMLAPFQFALGLVPTYARLGSNLCSDGSSVTCDSEKNQNLFQLDLGSCTYDLIVLHLHAYVNDVVFSEVYVTILSQN